MPISPDDDTRVATPVARPSRLPTSVFKLWESLKLARWRSAAAFVVLFVGSLLVLSFRQDLEHRSSFKATDVVLDAGPRMDLQPSATWFPGRLVRSHHSAGQRRLFRDDEDSDALRPSV